MLGLAAGGASAPCSQHVLLLRPLNNMSQSAEGAAGKKANTRTNAALIAGGFSGLLSRCALCAIKHAADYRVYGSHSYSMQLLTACVAKHEPLAKRGFHNAVLGARRGSLRPPAH